MKQETPLIKMMLIFAATQFTEEEALKELTTKYDQITLLLIFVDLNLVL